VLKGTGFLRAWRRGTRGDFCIYIRHDGDTRREYNEHQGDHHRASKCVGESYGEYAGGRAITFTYALYHITLLFYYRTKVFNATAAGV